MPSSQSLSGTAMDAFGTALATVTLLVQCVNACAAFSPQAKSLVARFEWDMRAIEIIKDSFRNKDVEKTLRPEDENLLRSTLSHLNFTMERAQRKLSVLQQRSRLGQLAAGIAWIARRSDLEDLETEIYLWTQRFGVHVVNLRRDLTVGTTEHAGPVAEPESPVPPVIRSNDRLRDFGRLSLRDKRARAREMLRKDCDKLALRITNSPYTSYMPLRLDSARSEDRDLVFSGRKVPRKVAHDAEASANLSMDMGMLAAALNCLDASADVRLLKVEYYFYHEKSAEFFFAHHAPFQTEYMTTLQARLDSDRFPKVETPLDQRLRFAYKLAEALLFLHTAEFFHKNITSSCVVLFHRPSGLEEANGFYNAMRPNEACTALENAYLMGFDLIRGAESRTTRQGAVKEEDDPRPVWEFDIYQHPDRQQGVDSLKYTKVYDVYSLGVVLLEVGLWQPVSSIGNDLISMDPSERSARLYKTAQERLMPRVGRRYAQLVLWCLALHSDDGMRESDFVENVLDPLDEMASALS